MENPLQLQTAELTELQASLKREIERRQRAEAAEHQHRILAEALQDTIAALNSALDLDKVLDRILHNIGRIIPYDGASIMLVEAGIARTVCARNQVSWSDETGLSHNFIIADTPTLREMAQTGRPLTIADTSHYLGWRSSSDGTWQRSYLGVPIQGNRQTLGFINLDSATAASFSALQAEQLRIFADHAAIAIRNAQTRELAVMRERERLAHELHDAVSQTLWSSTLIADVLPGLWEADAEKGREHLDELSQLIRDALTEMRSLLLQLRPTSGPDATIEEMLQQLVAAATNRTGITAQLIHGDNLCQLSPDTQFTLYRIAREAVNNVARHAIATELTISLQCQPDKIALIVSDNGCGFDPDFIPAGHLGIGIMRQRAEAIGGRLEISSQIGEGTQIKVFLEQ